MFTLLWDGRQILAIRCSLGIISWSISWCKDKIYVTRCTVIISDFFHCCNQSWRCSYISKHRSLNFQIYEIVLLWSDRIKHIKSKCNLSSKAQILKYSVLILKMYIACIAKGDYQKITLLLVCVLKKALGDISFHAISL